MTATPQIDLQPLEWAIVAALRDHGPALTTSQLRAHVRAAGFTPTPVSLRTRLATLTRFCVLVREREGGGGPRGAMRESRYRLRLQ